MISPVPAVKDTNALRFGILGAANIVPLALITPAKSHSEVIIAAVAARDPKKAETFAKKHGIPNVHKTYEDLINDPTLDVIYVPLPVSLHYTWALKALQAGKHVLLEKPSVSNTTEALSLFRHPILSQPNAPILLEAFHYRFHPAWQYFLGLFNAEHVVHVEVKNSSPPGLVAKDDIRLQYETSGGVMLDFGTYAVSAIRQIYGSEPKLTTATYRPLPKGGDAKIDEAMSATYEFANGGTASVSADLAARGRWGLPSFRDCPMWLRVDLRPVEESGEAGGVRKVTRKSFTFYAYMMPTVWHRIDVVTTIEMAKDGKVVNTKTEKESKKVYKWAEGSGEGKKGEEWWSTYRYQLEAFVDRVKGREGSAVWVENEDSIRHVEALDRTYEGAGLPVRPTCKELEGTAA
ncbi:NAD(P)-binding protein [Amniculicola lignicola CBS 123094]|uniref:D-xylose 1-dehydrogenase (NADP(+), D-xylono-1,5-lactone-forming) n=1 Tax=Amniculicola lignicola CBS 123094 TaxID=1392246 RepID=A0A6A5WIN7_9PLEO|nr:NAD(P)-binding protein [Amniculicola lignicola CBS 123094]